MLKCLQRGPSSLSRSFLVQTSPFRPIQSILSRACYYSLLQGIPMPLTRSFHLTSRNNHNAYAEAEEEVFEPSNIAPRRPGGTAEGGSVTKFAELAERSMVSSTVVNTITQKMGLETMTLVQSLTIEEILKGVDTIAQARTGTGKTLAFLIPVLQNIISKDPSLERRSGLRHSLPDIRAIIISPTRELAEQIAVEAQKVVRDTGVIVQTAVGGNSKKKGLQKIMDEGCHILVGTPGRLNDILKDPYSGVRAPKLSAFVLDEADRLLDQGFAVELQAIEKLLPDRRAVDRQTLMFSATMPREVMRMVESIMKPDYKFVRTVQPGELETHMKVPQKLVRVAGLENLMPALLELVQRELARSDTDMPFKAIVFFAANAEVKLANNIFKKLVASGDNRLRRKNLLHPTTLLEMHANLSQNERTRSSETFRLSKNSILFSSDVVSRGMDFPNVTHVIQMGLPSSRDVYVHRLGRTARGEKKGEGWLLLTPPEIHEARGRLDKLPLVSDTSLETAQVDMTKDAQLPASVATILQQISQSSKEAPMDLKTAAYKATLGIYGWMSKKQMLINMMNNRSRFGWGLQTPPQISELLARKLNLRKLEGVNFAYGSTGHRSDSVPRGGSSFRGSRGGSSFGRGRTGESGGEFAGRGGGFSDRPRPSFGDRSGGSFSDRPRQSFGDRPAGASFGAGGEQSFGSRGERSSGSSFSGRRDRSSGSRGGGSYGGRGGSREDRSSGRNLY